MAGPVVLFETRVKSGYFGDDRWSETILADLEAAAAGYDLSGQWTPPHNGTEACGCGN